MVQLIISGIPYAQFLDDVRVIINDSAQRAIQTTLNNTATSATAEMGGINLAQAVTGLSKARIYALVSARTLSHAKRGNKLYFNRAELLEWVAAGKRGK